MLEKPELPDHILFSFLERQYGLAVSSLAFLPLGADVNTAVYKADGPGGMSHFVKLRRGDFHDIAVLVPQLLRDRIGIERIVAPIPALSGDLWARLQEFAVILYPYVAGKNGFEWPLSDRNWIELGKTLRQMHTAELPAILADRIARESFTPYWRRKVKRFQAQVERDDFENPEAASLAAILRSERELVTRIVDRAGAMAGSLSTRSITYVLCHADIHAGNVLIDDDELFIVDWDTLVFAPKERDLMFVGAGIGGIWNSDRENELFYRGYGQVAVDSEAIAYYRYERIVQDIAEFCEQLLSSDDGNDDRKQSLGYFASQFQPGSVVDVALRSDPLT